MTPTPDKQAEREAFEAWRRRTAKTKTPDEAIALDGFGDDADYAHRATQMMWLGWQARSHLSDAQKKDGEASYPLPDSLYPDNKDWAASNYAGRVEWLHVMYESAKRTVAMLDGAPAAAEAQAVNTSESYERMRRALTIIANWTLPPTGKFWDEDKKTRPVSYEAEYGSNGARDYMKNLAAQTLLATPTDSAVNAGAVPRDADGDAFRKAAELGLTLRFYGGCAQSSAPGGPCAYEVVNGSDPAAGMREAINRAAAVIAKGGESQRLSGEAK